MRAQADAPPLVIREGPLRKLPRYPARADWYDALVHFLLMYETAADYLEKRGEHRAEHLALARSAARRGELVLAGAFADPVDGAALLFQGNDDSAARAFAEADPYVRAGLVTRWRIRPWTTVVGAEAAVRVPGGPAPPTSSKEITRASLVGFLRTARHWAVSSIAEEGRPQSAVVGVAGGDGLDLVFDTLDSTNKARNIGRDKRVSLVMWAGAATAQVEGDAELTIGDAEDRAKEIYFASFPDGRERAAWPGMRYVRIRPSWVRISDFAGPEPTVVALDAAALAALD